MTRLENIANMMLEYIEYRKGLAGNRISAEAYWKKSSEILSRILLTKDITASNMIYLNRMMKMISSKRDSKGYIEWSQITK